MTLRPISDQLNFFRTDAKKPPRPNRLWWGTSRGCRLATPQPIVARLNAAAVAALADQTVQTKLRAVGAEPAASDRNTQTRLASFLARNVTSGARSFARSRSAWSDTLLPASIA